MTSSTPPDGTGHDGVVFPLVDGERSTSATGRAILADAATAADARAGERIASAETWHKSYVEHARRLVELQAADPAAAVAVARAGLASLRRRFEFETAGERRPLDAAFDRAVEPLATITIEGDGSRDGSEGLVVPHDGELLRGDRLHARLDDWVARGIVEPSFAAAIRAVMAAPDWLDLSDRTIAVLGAGAELGPLGPLSAWGARVIAVDLPRAAVWDRIVPIARSGRGRVTVPVRERPADPADDRAVARVAGADLLTDLPALGQLLREVDGPLTVGTYAYADGADHVRVTAAADALVDHLVAARDDVSVAVLATPTDAFAVPPEVVTEARRRWSSRPRVQRLAGAASRGRLYAPNYPEEAGATTGRYSIADAIVAQQGPNYLLAKRAQRWRALAARADGLVSSINVAPTTATRSVTKNRVLAAAYAGAHRFDVEVFAPATANTLMAAMLVHDLRAGDSSAQPTVRLDHPLDQLWLGAAHSGLWRQPFAPRTVLPLAVAIGLPRVARPSR